jgi:hypothetical protein
MGFSWAFINPAAANPPDLSVTTSGLTATASLAAQGLTASVTGGFGAYTFSWSAVQPDGDASTSEFSTTSGSSTLFTPADAGLYSVTCVVEDSSTTKLTASSTQAKVIGTDLAATISGLSDSIFLTPQGVTASATGGTGGYAYSWTVLRPDNTVSTSEFSDAAAVSCSFTVSQKGTNVVRVRVTDSSAAIVTATSSAKIGVTGSDLNVSASGLVASSSVDPQSLSSSVAGGIAPYNFSWSSVRPDGTISTSEFDSATSATPIFTPQRVGLYSVTCTVTDTPDVSVGLTASNTLSKFIGTPLSASIVGLVATSSTDAQALTASVAGGTGSYSFSWSVIRPNAVESTSEFSNFSSASNGTLSQSCFFTLGYAGHNLVRCLVTDISSEAILATASAEIGITGSDLSNTITGFTASSGLAGQPITASVTGGIEPYTFNWSSVRPDGTVSTSEFSGSSPSASVLFTPARVGLYSVTCTATDSSSPILTASSNISKVVGTQLSVSITGIVSTASMSAQDVTASVTGGTGGESYIWSNASSDGTGSVSEYSNFSSSPLSRSATFTPEFVGLNSLSVRVIDNSGTAVETTASVSLGVTGSDLSLTTAGLAATASMDPQNLTATPSSGSGVYSYSWSAVNPTGSTSVLEFSSATVQNPVFSPRAAGLYSVTCVVTDNSSPPLIASSSQAKFIGQELSVAIIGIQQSSSMGAQDVTASASGGTGSYSYEWSAVLPPGITSSANYSNFSSSPLSESATFTPTIPGLHVLRVKVLDESADIFIATSSISLGVTGSDLSLTTAGLAATASMENQTLTSTPAGGVTPYAFSWSVTNPTGSITNTELNSTTTQNPVFRPLAAGLYSVTCTVTDSTIPALTASSTQTKFIGTEISGNIIGLVTTASNAAQDLTASITGGTGSYSFVWSSINPNGVIGAADYSNFSTNPLSQSTTFSASIQGVNVASVRVEDESGALFFATASAFIGVTSSAGGAGDLSLTSSGLTPASNLNAQNLTATAAGGTAPLAFSWTSIRPDGTTSTSEFDNASTQNPEFTPSRVGLYTVTCTVSDDATPTLSASHANSAFVGTSLAAIITSSAGGAINTTQTGSAATQSLTASLTGAGTGGETYSWSVITPSNLTSSTEGVNFSNFQSGTGPISQSVDFTALEKGVHNIRCVITDNSGESIVVTASADYGTENPYRRIQVMDLDGWTLVKGVNATQDEANACFISASNGIFTFGHTPIAGLTDNVPNRTLNEPKLFPVQFYSPENYLQDRLAPAMGTLGKEGKAGVLFLTMETVPHEDGTGKTSFTGFNNAGTVQSGGPRLICAYGIVSQPYSGDDTTPDFTLLYNYGHTSTSNYTIKPYLSVGDEDETFKALSNRSPGANSRVHLDAAIFIDNRGDPSLITISSRESDGTVYGSDNDSGTPTDFSDNVSGSRLYVGIGTQSTSTCSSASGSFRLFWNFVASQPGASETGTGANEA